VRGDGAGAEFFFIIKEGLKLRTSETVGGRERGGAVKAGRGSGLVEAAKSVVARQSTTQSGDVFFVGGIDPEAAGAVTKNESGIGGAIRPATGKTGERRGSRS
jgi:hypothetical protein